ncbi:MAG: sensor histidine kinase [Solimonas sp.]
MKWPRPRLRTLLILIHLVILALPLGGITWLRLYESALIRQTESELIAQGAFIEANYLSIFDRLRVDKPVRGARGKAAAPPAWPLPGNDYGMPLTAPPQQSDPEGRWRPRWAELDLASDLILPKPPEPQPTTQAADPLAVEIGRELTPILRRAQRITLAGIRVVDYRGIIVASTGDGARDDSGHSVADLDEVRRALSGEAVSRMRLRQSDAPAPSLASISRGTRIRVFVAEPIVRDDRVLGAILLVRTPANIKQAIYGKRTPLLRAGLGLLVLVVLLSLATSLLIGRPLRALIEQAHRAARGERGAVTPLRHPGTHEAAELSQTIADMAQALEARAQYIRDFAAHVSHEFKTPLTAIHGAVELLRDHTDSMSADERGRFMRIVDDETRRLEELVRKLLELARADMMQAGDERADVGAALEAVAARQRELGLKVEVWMPRPLAAAIGAETLASIVGSLLDNVRQHAGAGVSAQLSAKLEDGRVALHIEDNGSGISAANAERIFTPFFTTARTRGNTGLGLAIIRALLAAHRGSIELLPGGDAHFRIELPPAG